MVHGKKKVIYQWLKDGTEIQGQNGSSLVLDPVKLRDFGCYACRVKGADGSACVESSPATLDVTPRDGASKYHVGFFDAEFQQNHALLTVAVNCVVDVRVRITG